MVLLTKHPWGRKNTSGWREVESPAPPSLILGKEAIHFPPPATSLKVRSFDFRRHLGSEVSQREKITAKRTNEEMRAARPTFDFWSAASSLPFYSDGKKRVPLVARFRFQTGTGKVPTYRHCAELEKLEERVFLRFPSASCFVSISEIRGHQTFSDTFPW